jgi:hypothetical protein
MTPELALEAATTTPAGERVAVLFPDLTTDEVEERLAALFGVHGEALSGKLDRYEAELVRMFSERPEVWRTFMSGEIYSASLENHPPPPRPPLTWRLPLRSHGSVRRP